MLLRDGRRQTYHGVHEGAALKEDCGVVGELRPVDVLAVVVCVPTVPDVVVLIDKADVSHPPEGRVCLLGVRRTVLLRVPGEPGRDVEIGTVGDGVLVIIPVVHFACRQQELAARNLNVSNGREEGTHPTGACRT